jgi:ABC-2 type transport system ATP-binding protein
MNGTGIRLAGVRAGYGRRRILDGLSLEVPEGAVTALVGANGAGKTTLLRLCLGALKPAAGEVRVLGLDPIRDARRMRERIGHVPDKPDAYPWMRARDLFRFLAPHYPTWDRRRAEDLLRRLGVPERARFRTMSRGEGMKAMLAAALAHDPDALLLDEPFGGLDPLVREEVLRSVIAAAGERKRTILVSTHDLDVVARVADRVAVLHDGRIAREGPADSFVARDAEATTPTALRDVLASVTEGG